MTRKIAILGATGSVGKSTLDLIERNPQRFEVSAVTAARPIVLSDQAGDRDARILIEQWQHRLPDRTPDILEINVDAVWTSSRQLARKIGGKPRGIAIDPGGDTLYVSEQTSGSLMIVDTASGATRKQVPLGRSPEAIRLYTTSPRSDVDRMPHWARTA